MEKKYLPGGGKDYMHVNDSIALKINNQYINSLKSLAKKNKENKCTMCLHNDIRKHVHELVNLYPKGMYVRPHRHPIKTETKVIIEGKLLVITFDNLGKIIDQFVMEKEGIFIFRLEKDIIHTNIPLTDVVYYEVLDGPYVGKDDSVFPDWAPALDDEVGINKIMNRIIGEV